MKFSLLKTILAVSAALGIATIADAQVVTIGSDTVSQGGVATVSLDISGLGSGGTIGAFDVNVGFDPSVVNFASATYGGASGDLLNAGGPTLGLDAFTTTGSGTAEVAEFSLASTLTQPADFTLAQLTFDTLNVGTSALTLSVNALGDQFGSPIGASVVNGSVNVTGSSGGGAMAAPEMDSATAVSGLALLLGGLALIRGGRRGQRNA